MMCVRFVTIDHDHDHDHDFITTFDFGLFETNHHKFIVILIRFEKINITFDIRDNICTNVQQCQLSECDGQDKYDSHFSTSHTHTHTHTHTRENVNNGNPNFVNNKPTGAHKPRHVSAIQPARIVVAMR